MLCAADPDPILHWAVCIVRTDSLQTNFKYSWKCEGAPFKKKWGVRHDIFDFTATSQVESKSCGTQAEDNRPLLVKYGFFETSFRVFWRRVLQCIEAFPQVENDQKNTIGFLFSSSTYQSRVCVCRFDSIQFSRLSFHGPRHPLNHYVLTFSDSFCTCNFGRINKKFLVSVYIFLSLCMIQYNFL